MATVDAFRDNDDVVDDDEDEDEVEDDTSDVMEEEEDDGMTDDVGIGEMDAGAFASPDGSGAADVGTYGEAAHDTGSQGVPSLDQAEELKGQREIGSLASWTLSSAKAGSGVAQLRDDDTSTFWQSDGQQPHTINLQFPKCMDVSHVAIYVDIQLDESYTPQRLQARAGTNHHDLQLVREVELQDPRGWQVFALKLGEANMTKCHLLQIAIVANHQSGRDTHVRQLKIYSPRFNLMEPGQPAFTSHAFHMYSTLR